MSKDLYIREVERIEEDFFSEYITLEEAIDRLLAMCHSKRDVEQIILGWLD